jgi:hypothetical protein
MVTEKQLTVIDNGKMAVSWNSASLFIIICVGRPKNVFDPNVQIIVAILVVISAGGVTAGHTSYYPTLGHQ